MERVDMEADNDRVDKIARSMVAYSMEVPVFHYLDDATDMMRKEVLTQILAARDIVDKQGKSTAYKELRDLYKVVDRAADELEKLAWEFNRSGT